MSVRYISIVTQLLLTASILIMAQTGPDPSPQCSVIGRGAEGLAGEIQCRERALAAATRGGLASHCGGVCCKAVPRSFGVDVSDPLPIALARA